MVLNMIIAFSLAVISAAVFTPLTIKLAQKTGIMDIPNDARKIQSKPMPRIGGLAFIMAFFISCLFVFFTTKFTRRYKLNGIFYWSRNSCSNGLFR